MLHGRKEMGGGQAKRIEPSWRGGCAARVSHTRRRPGRGSYWIAQRARVSVRWRNGSRLPNERCVCGGDGMRVMAWMVCATGRALGVRDGSRRPRSKR
jgi:hypothetical protein